VRDRTGQGQLIDLSLLESQASYLTILAADFFATGKPPRPMGNAHPSIVPYQVFQAADRPVIVAVGSDKQWAQFCHVVGLGPEVRDDPRFATNPARLEHRAQVVALVEARLSAWPSADLLDQLRAAEIPCGPINSVPDVLADPHFLERANVVEQAHPRAGMLRTLADPVRLTDTPATYRLPPPMLGEHTEAVLTELGFTTEAIADLRTAGVL
jgi:crotonobetainyl-CoA:carnitine CoA-transferase CaiB-like acyl-CoA transferase